MLLEYSDFYQISRSKREINHKSVTNKMNFIHHRQNIKTSMLLSRIHVPPGIIFGPNFTILMLRFTSMIFRAYWILILALAYPNNARLYRKQHQTRDPLNLVSTVPNPSGTVPRLDQVEQAIREWPEGRIGGALGSSVPPAGTFAGSTDTSSSSTSDSIKDMKIDNLDASLKELENQSNSDLAKLSGSVEGTKYVLDVIRVNMTRFGREVSKNMTRLESLINDLGYEASKSAARGGNSLRSDVEAIQSQLKDLTSGSGLGGEYNTRISDLGTALSAVDKRVAALERRATAEASAQSAEADGAAQSAAASASFQFVLESWTGRVGLIATGLSIAALSLAIYLMTQMPKKPLDATAEEAKAGEEQVLLEAGEGGEGAADGAAEGEQGWEEGQEQYEEAAAEEQQQ